jgi:site-specific recombinase XerD
MRISPQIYESRTPAAHQGFNRDFWPVDNLQSWSSAPMETFHSWLAQQRILGNREFRESSVETYTAMFSVWASFLTDRLQGVVEARGDDVTAFFDKTVLEPVSRRRYLQLLERVYQHLAQCGRLGANPIQVELSKERELQRSLPPALDLPQQERLIGVLRELPRWKGARDRALGALLLGAGLRANEVIRLTRADIQADFRVNVRPASVHRDHESLIVPDGPWRTWYDQWLVERAEMGIPGDAVVPATAKGNVYEASGLFRRVRSWFVQADITCEQYGPNMLRSSFARNALCCGRYSVEQVQEFLGHSDSRATERHNAPVEGHD